MSKKMHVKLISAVVFISLIFPISAQAAQTITWDSSKGIKGQVDIPAGEVVTVAPNTKIKVADGARITIEGTLLAPGGLELFGKSWSGMEISGRAIISKFVEIGAQNPFRVAPSGSLIIHGGNISGILGNSEVEGSFMANGIRYDKGQGSGIVSNNGTGTIAIDHGTLLGAGRNSGDFFSIYGAKSIALTNSTMTGSHCAFHILGIQNMKLDHDYIFGNSYGFMMYGSSDSGSKTIANTTIKNNLFGFDEGSTATHNGTILIINSNILNNGKNLALYTGKVRVISSKK